MRLIKSTAVPIQPDGYELEDIYKSIEIAGRTCYKSEMGDNAIDFVNKMINSNHTAMLEHGTMYFDVPVGKLGDDPEYMWKSIIIQIFKKNPYSRVNKYEAEHDIDGTKVKLDHYAITTNYRVFIEQIDWDGLGPMRRDKVEGWELGLDKDYVLSFLCDPTEHHEKRYSFRIICDRGITHELVRHRVFSFAQESTRYCNYSKDKFNNEITFVEPYWLHKATKLQQTEFESYCKTAEDTYLALLGKWDERKSDRRFKTGFKDNPLTPQAARSVLPNALKAEIVMTGYESDWEHFINLRYNGTTGAPHPDMKRVAFFIAKFFERKS